MELGPTLANDDIAGDHVLAAEALHAQALALTVTAVAGRTATFFVRHNSVLLCYLLPLRARDVVDAQPGEVLAVPAAAAIPLLGLVLPHEDLGATALLDHRRLDDCTLDGRLADLRLAVIGDEQQHVGQVDRLALGLGQPFDV